MDIGKPIRTFEQKPKRTTEGDTKNPGTPIRTGKRLPDTTTPQETPIPCPDWPVRTKTPQPIEVER